MKNLVVLLSVFSVVVMFTSCSSDDVNDIKNASIEGSWELTEWFVKTPIDLNNDGELTTNFSPGCLNDSALVFSDSTNGTIFYSSSVAYNTRIEEDNLVFMVICSTSSDLTPTPISYTKSENTISINDNGTISNLILSGNTLRMEVPDGFVARDINTFEATVVQDVTYIFTKR